jgi:hypothetical protein
MDRDDPRSPFVAEWHVLEEMLEGGASFASLEAVIEEAQLDDEERAALWLASWARASRRDWGRLEDERRKGARRLALVN